MSIIRMIFVGGLVILAGVQLVPVARTNPPVTGDIPAPPDIKAILKNSCYDCHSHETVWPWYSHVAPISWQLAGDVGKGRRMLDFSIWAQYKPEKRSVLLENIADQVGERDMPPKPYTWMHPNARLSDGQVEAVAAWAKSAGQTENVATNAPQLREFARGTRE